MASFDVLAWNEAYRCGDVQSIAIGQIQETDASWTRTSIREGGECRYGDRSGLLPYVGLSLPCSLDQGFPEKYVSKPAGISIGVEVILRAMRHAKIPIEQHSLISFRNNLNKIALTVIDNKSPWTVNGCMLSELPGTAFLDIQYVEEESYPDAERFGYYGYKFESMCTGNDAYGVVDSTSEFAMVVSTKVQDLICALGAEIDCYDPSKATDASSATPASIIEIKTTKFKETDRQRKSAQRFKYPKWWFQSRIVGIPHIVVGYWKQNGEVCSIEHIQTEQLPSMALEGMNGYMRKQVWTPEQLVGFLYNVLQWMRGVLENDKDRQYRFIYRPEQKLIFAEIQTDGDLVDRVRAETDASSRP